ncbi:hypothetical protein ACVDHH_09510 [Staphylococcus saprophyticus]
MKIEKEFVIDIYDAEIKQTLLFFIGAGVSISQGYPDWNKYVDELIQYWKANLIKIIEDNRTDYTTVNRNYNKYVLSFEKFFFQDMPSCFKQ